MKTDIAEGCEHVRWDKEQFASVLCRFATAGIRVQRSSLYLRR